MKPNEHNSGLAVLFFIAVIVWAISVLARK
jgi:hypothetical protein